MRKLTRLSSASKQTIPSYLGTLSHSRKALSSYGKLSSLAQLNAPFQLLRFTLLRRHQADPLQEQDWNSEISSRTNG